MPQNVKKHGVVSERHPHTTDREPPRVASRLEGVVKNRGIIKKKKPKRRP